MLRRVHLVLLAAATFVPALARAEAPVLLDRVVARVDAHTIYRSDVVARAQPYLRELTRRRANDPQKRAELAREVLARIIEDKLVEKECARAQIGIEEHEVDRAIDELAKENKTARKGLFATAREEGLTEDAYRAEVRRQLLELKWTSFVLRPRLSLPITGTEAEKEAAEKSALAAERKKALAEARAAAFVEVRW